MESRKNFQQRMDDEVSCMNSKIGNGFEENLKLDENDLRDAENFVCRVFSQKLAESIENLYLE
jgi:hypothetical protein